MFRPLGLALVLFAAPLRAQQREAAKPVPLVPPAPVAGVTLRPDAIPGLASPNGLSLPTALPALGAAAAPAAAAISPKAAAAVLPSAHAAGKTGLPPADAKTAAHRRPASDGAMPAVAESGRPPAGEGAAGVEGSGEALTQEGLVRFDQGKPVTAQAPEAVEPRAPSFWSRAASWLTKADEAPPFPGRPGGKVRIAGKTYTLGTKLSENAGVAVYRASDGRDRTLTLFAPEAAGAFAGRKRDLEALAATEIPHARLLAASPAARILVQETPEEIASFRLGAGPLASHQMNALADLAARLLAAGRSAELSPRSMLWDHWRETWRLRDGADFAPAGPTAALGQLLDPGFAKAAGLEPAAFLSALRGRLGPDSAAWKGTVAAAAARPHLKAAFDALAAADALQPPAPPLRFVSGRADARLDDSWVDRGELRARLGFDPFTEKSKVDLHTDDPGKLNTRILQVAPENGGEPRVMKSASLEIIRNELFIRKVLRRWFGAYLETPRALAVRDGNRAVLVMERAKGSRSYTGAGLSLEQRLAFGILAHSFGLGDVNPGNVLFHAGELPVLIDFEQALSRHRPAPRIPDEGILQELPWVNGPLIPTIEQYGPSIRAWRALLAEPATRAELEAMLLETGWDREEAARRLATLYDNSTRLEWLLQSDIEFARGFARRRAP